MICVTGAGGTVGGELVSRLESTHAPFRAAYFSLEKAEAIRARGIEAAVIDYHRPETLYAAFQECDTLFLLGPNVADQTQLELNAVKAAERAGVRHIVKLSVMGAHDEAYAIARVHRPVEKAIESSGIGWTFLRPNSFMQNVATYLSHTIKGDGVFYSASGDGKISHVDVRDIVAVAVQALTGGDHKAKAYTLTGPEALTYDELARELSTAVGHPIRHISLAPADLKQAMLTEGMPAEIADRMLDLERYYREGHAGRITDDIKQATGREPRRFAEYAREIASSLT